MLLLVLALASASYYPSDLFDDAVLELDFNSNVKDSSGSNNSGVLTGYSLNNGTLNGFPVPVAHYKFNGNALDEGGLYNGTVTGATLTADGYGVASRAYSFDGIDNVISSDGVLAALSGATKGTFSAWVKLADSTPTAAGRIVNFGDTNAVGYINLDIGTTGLLEAASAETGSTKWTLKTDNKIIFNNTWVHVSLVHNGIEALLYVDGVAVPQTFSSSIDKVWWFANSSVDNLRFGAINFNSGGDSLFSNMTIDDVQIYDSALTATEVSRLFNRSSTENHAVSPYVSDHNNLVDSALSFDGVNDYVNLSSLFSTVDNQSSGSISFWAKYPQSSANRRLFSAGVSGSFLDIYPVNNEGLYFIVYSGGASKLYYHTSVDYDDNAWHHYTFTVGGSGNAVYVDGVLDTPVYTTGDANTVAWFNNVTGETSITLGERGYLHDRKYNGSVDDFRVYNRSLSASEISAEYNNSLKNSFPLNNTGLVARYAFHNNSNDSNWNTRGEPYNQGGLFSDGNSKYYTAPSGFPYNLNKSLNYSISLFFQLNDYNSNQVFLGSGLHGADRISFTTQENVLKVGHYIGSHQSFNASIDKTFQHVMLVNNEGTFYGYLNGVLQTLSGVGPNTATNVATIINARNDGLFPFNGTVSKVVITTDVKDAIEAKQMYACKPQNDKWDAIANCSIQDENFDDTSIAPDFNSNAEYNFNNSNFTTGNVKITGSQVSIKGSNWRIN